MRNSITQNLKLLALALVIGLGVSYVFAASSSWSGPTVGAPNGNTPTPINVSTTTQNKLGILGVGGLGSNGTGYFSTSTYTLPSLLTLGVNGSVGATQYCDQNGANCTIPSDSQIIFLHSIGSGSAYTKEIVGNNVAMPNYNSDTYWTLSELKAGIPEIAAETRPIRGVVLNYSTIMTGPSGTQATWYHVAIATPTFSTMNIYG